MATERRIVEAQVLECLPEVVVGLACRCDAEPRPRRLHRDPVEPVGGGERPGGLEAPVHDLALGVQRVGRQKPGDLARLPRAPLVDEARIRDAHPVGIHLRGTHRVGNVGHDLEGHPEPRVARQLEAEAPEVEDVLDAAGEEHRHLEVVEGDLRMSGQRRRFGLRIVARQRQHAPVPADARDVRVAEDVAAPVDAGRLAVPHAENAVVARAPVEVGELAAEHGSRAEVLVHAGDENHLVLSQEVPVAFDRLVQTAEGRPPVPGDEGRRVETAAAVRAMLVEREANEGLDTGHEDTARLESILHLEGEGAGSLQGRFHAAAPRAATRNAKGAGRPPAARLRPPTVRCVSGSRTRPGRIHSHRRSPGSPKPRPPVRS